MIQDELRNTTRKLYKKMIDLMKHFSNNFFHVKLSFRKVKQRMFFMDSVSLIKGSSSAEI